jgi:hypothetical protein
MRFANAAEVLQAIDELGAAPETPGRRSKIGFEPTVPAAPAPEPEPEAEPAPRTSAPPRRARRKKGRSFFGTVLLFLLVLGASFAAAALLAPRDLILPHVARFLSGGEAGGGDGDADAGPLSGPTLAVEALDGDVPTMVFTEGILDGGAVGADATAVALVDAGPGDAGIAVIGPVDAGHDGGPSETETAVAVQATASGRPPPVDLLGEPLGRRLAPLARRARTASRPPHFAALYEYARENPSDPRIHLILAHAFVRLGWRSDAITRYEQAAGIDPRARGDRSMLPDLIALTADRSHGRRAADAIVAIYGAEARPTVEAAARSASPDDADTRRRLSALARRLR